MSDIKNYSQQLTVTSPVLDHFCKNNANEYLCSAL